jgi:hypothetical protein
MRTTSYPDWLTKQQTVADCLVLSVYQKISPPQTGSLDRHFEGELLAQLRSVEAHLSSESERRSFAAAAVKVRDFVAQHKPTGQGMILFCSNDGRLFWWRDVKVPVANEARWSRRPYTRPLLELQDEFERYCIILADREQGHLFTVFMGEVEQHFEFASAAEVKHSKKPGSDHIRSQMQFQRKADLHAFWHLKRIVRLAERQRSVCPYDRLILAGPSETTGALHRLLPKRLSARLVAAIPLPVSATPQQVLKATLDIEEQFERKAEVRLVEDLLSSASKGMKAVTGLAATLLASNNGEIWKLVYAQDSTVPGKRCSLCQRLYEASRFVCGHCSKPLEPVDDLIELMAERLAHTGRRLEQVRGEASERLKEVAGIGAFLLMRGRRSRSARQLKGSRTRRVPMRASPR